MAGLSNNGGERDGGRGQGLIYARGVAAAPRHARPRPAPTVYAEPDTRVRVEGLKKRGVGGLESRGGQPNTALPRRGVPPTPLLQCENYCCSCVQTLRWNVRHFGRAAVGSTTQQAASLPHLQVH